MKVRVLYKPFIIKEYPRWTLILSEKQLPYVGRCYAWWKDNYECEGEGKSPADLSPEDLVEVLRTIFRDVLTACKALGHRTDLYGTEFLLNTAYLANEPGHNHHMHWHYIPRFKEPVKVAALIGEQFEDLLWGKNYSRIKQISMDPQDLLIIRNIMAAAIGGPP